MEQRELGRTGEKLSVVGFGGIVVMNATPADAARFVGEAVDAGVTYFDVAPSYGNAQERLGPALEPYRSRVFLACKTGKRTRNEAALELRQSLAHLKTDHVDLYQLHGLTSDEEVQTAFGPGGAMEELVEAKQLGLVRHLGFSAHSEHAALTALAHGGFDSVLFPINWYAWNLGGFGPRVVDAAAERGVGRLALKAMAHGKLAKNEARDWGKCWYRPLDDAELAATAVRWTLSQPITAAVSPSHIELLRLMIRAVADLRPPTDDEIGRLRAHLGQRQPVFEQA